MENQGITIAYQLEYLLEKARNESFACIFLSAGRSDDRGQISLMAGFGVSEQFSDLSDVPSCPESPVMGYLGYDYKNQIEPSLVSELTQLVEFDALKFVSPERWVAIEKNGIISGDESLLLHRGNQNSGLDVSGDHDGNDRHESSLSKLAAKNSPQWQSQTPKETYLENVERIKQHIVDGDFYEMNYCIAFTAIEEIDPYGAFMLLSRKAPAPFSVFLKDGDRYLLCASPERFFGKRGNLIFSQPIKGTRPRVFDSISSELDEVQDLTIARELEKSEKDRAENIMIVDLVRNDLSKVCEVGSVQVPECCAVYSFSHVHQLISTVEGRLKPEVGLKDLMHATFPMGSMTGAPKISVMQHTNHLEGFARGIYSGTVGYVWKQNMDFNVVIRALQYDSQAKTLAYAVGGAITYDSVAQQEYQECLDKASAVLSIFETN
ncbi:MAG: anthranilate synthase component I family protein [Bacteroidetes bacterium]|nr:anthranilate synthase component I family protein [Bacteroidota bacterium]MDA1224440.1 anthranilate synthase component I family protein [Bacteroidota bacterium]